MKDAIESFSRSNLPLIADRIEGEQFEVPYGRSTNLVFLQKKST